MKKSIFIWIFFLLLLSFANASSDVYLRMPNKQFCPCEPITIKLNILNNQPFSDTYTLNSNIFNEKFVYSENPITLEPKEEKETIIYINLGCEIFGDINGYLNVKSAITNSQYSLPYTLNINPCYNFSLRAADFYGNNTYKYHTGIYNFCSEDIKKIPVLITNDVAISNVYRFKVDGPDFAELEYNNIVLGERQKGIAIIDLNTESIGDYTFDFTAESDIGKIKRNISFEASVGKCYGLDIIFNDSLEICGCEKKAIKGFVSNNGKSTEKADINIKGPAWATLDKTNLLIAGESKKEFDIEINPGQNCTYGRYDIKLNAELSDNPDVKAEKSAIVKLVSQEDCGKVKVFNFKSFFLYLSALVTLLIILLIVALMIKHRKPSEEKIDDTKKEKIPKKEPKKAKKQAKAEKKIKKESRTYRNIILPIIWIIIVIAAIAAVIYYYKLWSYINDFLVLYWAYIIAGIALLLILILFLRFYKPKEE